MNRRLLTKLHDLIDEYALHESGAPVDLSALHAICPVTYTDMRDTGMVGWCFAPKPATRTHPACVGICSSLTHDQRRIAYAHEVVHALAGHSGAITLSDLDPWFEDKQEREAWQGTALLLIPPLEVLDGEITRDTVARACHIPPMLVDMYP